MRNSESRSSYYHSRSRSRSRDDDSHRNYPDRDRKDRDREDKEYYSRRRHRSTSRSYSHKSKKSRHSKKSNKYRSRRSSSRSSSSSSYSSDESSRESYRHRSEYHRRSGTRAGSSESNSRLSTSSRAKSKSKVDAPSASKSVCTTKQLSEAVKDIDIHDSQVRKALETIEEDSFVQDTFYSTRDREAPSADKNSLSNDKVVIDLNAETITVSKPISETTGMVPLKKEEIFHPNFLGDADVKAEKWLRKLYNFRQKYYESYH